MAQAPKAAVTPADIVFELEQFERSNDRLTLSGRWFGVRGRRFVRPTLTLAIDGERIRALADLDDKPWAAEDGESWTASFPARKRGRVEELELSVAPDITIQLPAPGGRRTRSQRLEALPRRDAMTASWRELAAIIEAPPAAEPEAPELAAEVPGAAADAQAAVAGATSAADATGAAETSVAGPAVAEPEPEAPGATAEALRAETEGLLAQLAEAQNALTAANADRDSAGAELESARAQLSSRGAHLEELQRQLGARDGESKTAQAELAATRAAREAALRSAAQAEAEREHALTRAAHAEAERDALAADKAELASALERSKSTVERLNREHDEAVTARGAALVMRGATQALPAYERHVGWVRRALAVLVLLGIVFAVLVVLQVL